MHKHLQRKTLTGFFTRRNFSLALLAVVAQHSWAQASYPTRPVRVVVPFAAGSSPDVIARYWGERMAKATNQPFIIDNKPGASTIIGAQDVARAPPDGHTLLYTVNNTTSINPYVYKKLPYQADSFSPVIRILSVPYVLVVSSKSPIKTLPDLVSAARERPGALNYASLGIGQGTHVAMAAFLNSQGLKMTHVPYKDGGLTDVMSGAVDVSFEASTTAIPQVTGGKIRAIAVSGPRRVSALAGIPTVAELVPGFRGDSWHGVMVPKGTPSDIIGKIATASQRIIETGEFQQKLKDYGLVPSGGTPEDFRRFLIEDANSWEKVVRDNGIHAE